MLKQSVIFLSFCRTEIKSPAVKINFTAGFLINNVLFCFTFFYCFIKLKYNFFFRLFCKKTYNNKHYKTENKRWQKLVNRKYAA